MNKIVASYERRLHMNFLQNTFNCKGVTVCG